MTASNIDLSWAEAQFAAPPPGEHYWDGGRPPCQLDLGETPDSPLTACPDPAVCRVILYHLGQYERPVHACAAHRDKALSAFDGVLAGRCPNCRAWIFLLRVEPL